MTASHDHVFVELNCVPHNDSNNKIFFTQGNLFTVKCCYQYEGPEATGTTNLKYTPIKNTFKT